MGSQQTAVVAAEISASQFGDRPELVESLPDRENPHLWSDGLIASLCLGWPEDPVIDELYRELNNPDRPEVSVVSYVALTYSRVPSAQFVKQLQRDLSEDHVAARSGLSMAPSVVVQRVRRDQAVREELEHSLKSGLTSNCKISIPRILAMANGVSLELAAWCREEIKRQLSEGSIPELGFDMFTGEVRSVVYGLLDVVDGRS